LGVVSGKPGVNTVLLPEQCPRANVPCPEVR
jgi:hypothetical protein